MTVSPRAEVGRRYAEIPVDLIDFRQNVREISPDDEEIRLLARSLRERQIHPIVVRPVQVKGSLRYELWTGHRRVVAARVGEIPSLLAELVDEELTEAELLALQLIENCLREGLPPLAQALAFQQLRDLKGWNDTQLADALHVNKSTVSRSLALNTLPGDVREAITVGGISPAAGRELGRLKDAAARAELLAEAKERRLRPEAIAKRVNANLFPKPSRGRPRKERVFKLTGFEAVLTPKRFVLSVTGANRKRTPQEYLEAIEAIAAQIRTELSLQNATTPA